ncbi:hypothetical protein SDC9_100763 [bioreactor metagenome]|uniref:IS66 family transposase ISBaps1 n=1 Tax=bioreactor metagenome TaxID=1076179 RepID=A0A645ANW8_9ZZZZ|nr:IS66 family insertion sequence element accessory protein TnpB [Rikenellaceae bacterium]
MFSLNDSMRYWLYSEPTDMRKSFFSLSGIVTNLMEKDIHSGDVFIFLNKPRTRIKLLHMESGGLVLYSKILDGGTFARPTNIPNSPIEWRDLVMMVEGIVENPTYRRKRIRSLRDRHIY